MGELLLVDACIGDPQCPAALWEQMLAVQRPDGLTPGITIPSRRTPTWRSRTTSTPP
ncbi:DUF6895 family protein [Streptomyces sp. NPDC002776]